MTSSYKQKCLHETEIIDLVLEKGDSDQVDYFQHHLSQCRHCNELYYSWAELLDVNKNSNASSPTPLLKERIWKSILQNKNDQKKNSFRPLIFIPVLSIFIIIILFVGLYSSFHQVDPFSIAEDHQRQLIVDSTFQDTQEYHDFIIDPATMYFDIIPILSQEVQGRVWIKESTNELYLFVDGLSPLVERDYQAWLSSSYFTFDAGLLQVQSGKGHLYIQGNPLHQVEQINVSIEPKGGSKLPTGPDSFIIPLSN